MDDHITTTTTTTSAADDAVKQAVKRRRDSDSLTDSEVPALFSLRASNIKYHHYYTDDMKRSAWVVCGVDCWWTDNVDMLA